MIEYICREIPAETVLGTQVIFQTQLHNTVRDICWIMKTQTVSIALAALILNLLLIAETDCLTAPIPGKREVEAKVSFFSLTFYIWYGNQTIIRI